MYFPFCGKKVEFREDFPFPEWAYCPKFPILSALGGQWPFLWLLFAVFCKNMGAKTISAPEPPAERPRLQARAERKPCHTPHH